MWYFMCVLFSLALTPSTHCPFLLGRGPGIDPQVAGELLVNTAGAHHYQRQLKGSDPHRASRQIVSGAWQRRHSPSEKVLWRD